MRVDARVYIKAKRAGRATSVRVAPTGTAVEQYQIPLGQRHSLKDAGVVGMPSWSDRATQTETWVKVPRLSATCPRRVVAFEGGLSSPSVFFLNDTFDDGVIDPSWNVAGLATAVEANGYLETTGIENTWTDYTKAARRAVSISGNFEVIVSLNTLAASNSLAEQFVCLITSGDMIYAGIVDANSTDFGAFAAVSGSTTVYYSGIGTRAEPVTTQIRITRVGSTVTIYENGISRGTATNAAPVTEIRLTNTRYQTYAGHTARWDNLRARNYVPNEPVAGTAKPTATNRALSRPMSHADLMRAVCA